MNTCEEEVRMLSVQGTSFRARGCVVTEEHIEDPAETERVELQRRMDQEVEQRVRNRLKEALDAQQAICARCSRDVDRLFQRMESDIREQLIELSLCIAETILKRELPDGEMLRQVLRDALEPITDFHGIRIRLAPDDADLLMGDVPDAVPGAKGMEWVVDPNLATGDVLVESRNGIFDGRLRQRLAALAEAIARAGQRRPAPDGSMS